MNQLILHKFRKNIKQDSHTLADNYKAAETK